MNAEQIPWPAERTILAAALAAALCGCIAGTERSGMNITSPEFKDQQSIPSRYTCDGADVIPPLEFKDVPPNTASLALIVDDPDAPMGTWDHWVVWNMPPETRGVIEGAQPAGIVGRNSWGKREWGGPCPPDREHHYFFKLFALDTTLQIAPESTKHMLEQAMQGHVLEEAYFVGRYERERR